MRADPLQGRWRFILVASVAVQFVACANETNRKPLQPTSDGRSEGKASAGPLILSAAASTKDAVESLAKIFSDQTGIEVKVNPGPSSGLASQIIADAPADLFLSASQQWADEVSKEGKAVSMARLLTNKLVLVVPTANPGEIREPKDLLAPGVKKIALAGEKVPAGTYADQALTKLKLLEPLVSAGKIVR